MWRCKVMTVALLTLLPTVTGGDEALSPPLLICGKKKDQQLLIKLIETVIFRDCIPEVPSSKLGLDPNGHNSFFRGFPQLRNNTSNYTATSLFHAFSISLLTSTYHLTSHKTGHWQRHGIYAPNNGNASLQKAHGRRDSSVSVVTTPRDGYVRNRASIPGRIKISIFFSNSPDRL